MVSNTNIDFDKVATTGRGGNSAENLLERDLAICSMQVAARGVTRTTNCLENPLWERPVPNGEDVREASDVHVVNISAIHTNFENPKRKRWGHKVVGVGNTRNICPVNTTKRKSPIEPQLLARNWNITEQMAKDTLEVTTQRGVRNPKTLERRFPTQSFRNKKIVPGK